MYRNKFLKKYIITTLGLLAFVTADRATDFIVNINKFKKNHQSTTGF